MQQIVNFVKFACALVVLIVFSLGPWLGLLIGAGLTCAALIYLFGGPVLIDFWTAIGYYVFVAGCTYPVFVLLDHYEFVVQGRVERDTWCTAETFLIAAGFSITWWMSWWRYDKELRDCEMDTADQVISTINYWLFRRSVPEPAAD